MFNRFLILIVLLLLASGIYSASAQADKNTPPPSSASQKKFFDHFNWIPADANNVHEFHIVGGYSFHSSRGFWGKIPKGELQVFGLRYNRKILELNNKHLIEYVTELNLSVDYTLVPTKYDYGAGHFWGFGATPLGFQLNFNEINTLQPFLKTSTGFMYFRKRFPSEEGMRFNFTLELGGGVELLLTDNISFTLGYKYHHMSNFFFGTINPGIDSNIFYTGITIF
ncbi:acyloxyacyl hydrolase [Fodinibius halophilus]|uniref:Acyloxyacyl hydrolase n=1 Tax=Fodinibius halophilus TaxID=1736908 RepID=A0A6M1T1M7_9BACT|nr:acyloxyacyl hydrolase [Fodinibius halophilus]NGP87907.1 acyloxyacyl hydrolase [Fodinibius halophilus]